MNIFIIWIIFCFIVASIAKSKKLGYWGGFFLSLFFSPLIGLIFALISKPKERNKEKATGQYAGTYNAKNQKSNVTTYKKRNDNIRRNKSKGR
jgi:Na+/H+-dicarboxylate symporter